MNQSFPINKDSFTKMFLNTLLKVSDNASLVSALLLDAIYKDYHYVNSNELIYTIFKKLKSDLHPQKIEGLIDALLEYQLNFTISESVYNELTELLVSRIFDGDKKDFVWINKIFKLFTNSYSFRRLNNLLSVIFIPRFEIPKDLIDDYMQVVKKCIKLEKYTNKNYTLSLNQLCTRLSLEISNRSNASDYIISKYGNLYDFMMRENKKQLTSTTKSKTNTKTVKTKKTSSTSPKVVPMKKSTSKKRTPLVNEKTPSKGIKNGKKIKSVTSNATNLNFDEIIEKFRFINKENYEFILSNYTKEGFVTNHVKVKELFNLVDRLSTNDKTTIILGPSKSGKSTLSKLLARQYLIHQGLPKEEIETKIITDLLIEQNFQDINSARKKLFGDMKEGNLRSCSFYQANNGVHILDEFGRGKNKVLKILEPYIRQDIHEYNHVGSQLKNEIFTKYIIVSSLELDMPAVQKKLKIAPDTIGRSLSNKIKYPHLDEIKEDIPLLINFFLYKDLNPNTKTSFEIPLNVEEYKQRIVNKNWKNEYHSLHDFISELYQIFSKRKKITKNKVLSILGNI